MLKIDIYKPEVQQSGKLWQLPQPATPWVLDDYDFARMNELVNQEGHKFINMMRFGYLMFSDGTFESAKFGRPHWDLSAA